MFSYFLRLFGPKFKNQEETLKFVILAACAFCTMGAQWPLKILKDGLLVGELGVENQPVMRILSVFVCFSISLVYGQLVNMFRREVVLYLIVAFLSILGFIFYGLLSLYPLGVLPFAKDYVIRGFYLYADAFAVLTIPPFWAFVNDMTNPDEARRGYGFVFFAAQLGALVTVLMGRFLASNNPSICLMCTVLLIIFAALIFLLVHDVDKASLSGYEAQSKAVLEKHNITFLRGLGLLLASPYVSGILFLTIAPDMLIAVINFKWLTIVKSSFPMDNVAMMAFMFDYSLLVQIVSCLFSLLGGFFFGSLGIHNCIVLYPILLLICVLLMKAIPTLWVVTIAFALIRGLHHALNKPAREGLYIPTTKDVKYKSKAWIEVFGSRISKATGSSICKLPSVFVSVFLLFMPLVWVVVAAFVGQRYDKSVLNNETVV